MASILERWGLLKKPTIINVTLSDGDVSTQVLNMKAKELYRTQDNLQAVVNFLSNSIAQLPLKVYIRDGENERRRDRDSVAARLLWRPNADQTCFEFIRALMVEYYVCGSVYVWVLPDADSDSGYQLRIVPTEWIIPSQGEGGNYAPNKIRICTRNGGTAFDIPRDEFIQFRTYSAGHPGGYLSPISALKNTLTEQVEAGRFRRQLWKSSGRLNAQITRPKDVAPWTDEQRKKFVEAFRDAWSGKGSKAGAVPVFEDGMRLETVQTSFKEAEWSQGVILTREAVAAAYGVNPSLIWHSNTQTYASSRDNARALYAECLGPVIQMLQQRINAFLLPKIGADRQTYVEFDMNEKLKGSFEERAAILQSAVGAPWLTRNEARADLNLPRIDGGDELITPLNVTEGGQASPRDTQGDAYNYPGEDNRLKRAEVCECKACKENQDVRIKGKSDAEDDEKVEKVLTAFFKRQARSVIPKLGADNADFWDADRWDKELAEDLEPVLIEISDKHGEDAAETLGIVYGTEVTRKYLKTASAARAKKINENTLKHLEKDMQDDEPDPVKVFEDRETTSGTLARAAAGAIASFAITEAAHQAISDGASSVRGRIVEKEWITGPNARPSHAAMNGERVPLDADFSNGQHWPGENIGDPEESCGCNCTTEVVITGG